MQISNSIGFHQNMKINVIDGKCLTVDHVTAWSHLQNKDSAINNPFLSPEFIMVTASVCDNVNVAVLEQNDEFVGFFPFQRVRQNIGRAVAWRMSDMHGIVLKKNVNLDAKQLLKECKLSAWHFDHLVASQTMFKPFHHFIEDSPYMDLSEGFKGYQFSRRQSGSAMISQFMRKSRKIEREIGPLRFEMHTTETAAFRALLTWKQEQLNRKNYIDVFPFKWVVDLLDLVWRTESEGLSGMLSCLYAGDQLISVHMGMRSHHVISSWIPTFDNRFGKYSPGLLLHIELAKHAAKMGIKQIDLGRGYNQLKASLMSGSFPVAVGSVELRPINRIMKTTWYGVRDLVYSSPFREPTLGMYRRLRNWMMH